MASATRLPAFAAAEAGFTFTFSTRATLAYRGSGLSDVPAW